MPLSPGDHIERYVIDGLLGSGGMGDVYRAHDPRLKRAVALKILHAEPAPDANDPTSAPAMGAAARMLREAQLAASFDHPNVVSVFDVGQLETPIELRGTTYLAMELIRGESLRRYVGDATVKMKVRVRWLEEIARALGAAHAAGLVHRDIKPENVMIRSEDARVKILDFGVAKRTMAAPVDATSSTEGYAVPTMTAKGVVVGTPLYMAPEQLRAEPLDGRADQFAWGVVAYELITGKAPWSLEGGGFSLVAQILQAPPPSLSAVPDVPARVSAVVTRALAKDPAARFPTMAALLEELTGKTETGDTLRKISVSQPVLDAPESSRPDARATEGVSNESRPPPAADTKRSEPERRASTVPSPPLARRSFGRGAATMVGLGVILLGFGGAGWLRARATRGTAPSGVVASTGNAGHPAAGCASNAECRGAHGGKPYVCRADATCAPLESEDCQVRADDRALDDRDTFWIGTMYPLKGELAARFGIPETDAIDLGRRDFREVLGGFGGPRAGRVRPIGLVTCDDSVDAARAARHLVDDARVPAVIGFGKNAEAVELAESVFLPKLTLVVSAFNSSPMITSIPSPPGQPRLVWRTMFSTTQKARALVALVSSVLEPQARKARGASPAPLRVALLRINTMAAFALADAIEARLVFNDKTAVLNGSSFRDVVVSDPLAPGAKPAFGAAVSELLAFAPDIVLYTTPDVLAKNVVLPLEERWPRGLPHPLYANADSIPRDLFPFMGTNVERRRRFFGITNVSSTPNNARLVTHFNESFPEKVARTSTPNGSYDALYVLAYASVALGPAAVTGPGLSLAFARLEPPGKAVDVGPFAILEGYAALAGGSNIDLDGTIGHLDFDPATGEAPVDMAVLCVDVDRQGVAVDGAESGLTYDARESALRGQMHCP